MVSPYAHIILSSALIALLQPLQNVRNLDWTFKLEAQAPRRCHKRRAFLIGVSALC